MRAMGTTLLALALLWPATGNAQDRAFVSMNAISQASNDATSERALNHPPSDPTLRYEVASRASSGSAFDVAGGMRVWRSVSLGLAVSHFSGARRTDVDSRDRSARRGTVVRLEHRQLGYHVQMRWAVRVADRLDVAVFAGPSVFRVRHARVTDVEVVEGRRFPDSDYIPPLQVAGVTARDVTDRRPGFNYGFDFTVRVTDRVGVGILVRTAESIRLSSYGNDGAVPVAGGSHVGIGARVRF